jgi:hypothetical protein
MEDTCKKESCWFYIMMKDLVGNKDSSSLLDFKNCPFYQEMIFTPQAIGEKIETAKVVKDCTNKRSLLILLEEIYPRVLGVQKSHEEMRNSSTLTANALFDLLSAVNVKKQLIQKDIITITE